MPMNWQAWKADTAWDRAFGSAKPACNNKIKLGTFWISLVSNPSPQHRATGLYDIGQFIEHQRLELILSVPRFFFRIFRASSLFLSLETQTRPYCIGSLSYILSLISRSFIEEWPGYEGTIYSVCMAYQHLHWQNKSLFSPHIRDLLLHTACVLTNRERHWHHCLS